MDDLTAHDGSIPFSGNDWFGPLEEAVRCKVRGYIETIVEQGL
jgi:hypothetical protein